MFDKIKEFNKKHPNAIPIAVMSVTAAVGCGVAYYCGAKSVRRHFAPNKAMEIIVDVLNDIPDGAEVKVFGGIYTPGIPAKELGALGEEMIKKGANELTDLFTHFIAIKKMDT